MYTHNHIYIYTHNHIYIYIYTFENGVLSAERVLRSSTNNKPFPILLTVSFHNFKSQNVKLSVSNPKSKCVACPFCLKFQIARV